MGRGRAPCCDKIGLKKGPWTPAEDIRLISFIQKYGHGNWRALPKQAGLLRCGKSCRLRWTNYLRPDIKRGNFTIEEEETIIKLHESLGNKWSKIAFHLPGRTDNEIKNVWNTHLKKRVISKGPNSSRDEDKESTITSSSFSSNSSTSYSNHDMGRGNEEQPLLIAALDGSCAVDEMVHMEEKQDPLMDIAALESSVDIWDLLDDRIDHENQNNCKTNFKGNSVSDIDSPSLDVLKELSRSSTSSCSSHSDPVDGSRSEKDQLTLFNNERPCAVYETINEVKKQDILEEMLEIQFEPNFDVWDMIEDEPYFLPSSLVPLCEVETHQHLTIQEYEDEVESKKWVAYLENELGLQTMIDYKQEILTRDAAEPLVPITTTGDDEMMKVEFDPVATYFQI